MPITALFNRLSKRSRQLKMQLLSEHLRLEGGERLLDIGSQVDRDAQQLLERVSDKGTITAVNVTLDHLRNIKTAYPAAHPVLASACELPFADKSYDIVYSNAVIEHVGGLPEQTRMAREIQRVGRRWFVTTPNRWYPFEFHARMPLISWLPPSYMRIAAKIWSYNHVRRRYKSGNDYSRVQLLTARQLRAMFPDSLILKPRVTFWPETLVVVGPISNGPTS